MKNTTCCKSQVSPGRTVLSWTASTRHCADLCRAGEGQSARGPREASSGGLGSPTPAQSGSDLSTVGGPLQQGGSGGHPAPSRSPGQVLLPTLSSSGGGRQAQPHHLQASGLSLHGQRQRLFPGRPTSPPSPQALPLALPLQDGGAGVARLLDGGAGAAPLSRQRVQALLSPGRQGRGSLSPGWGRPQAPWPSWRPAVSLTVCCDAHPTQREKADSVPHSGLTEPCLPTSSQSSKGSGRETEFKVQATSLSCSKKLLEAPARLRESRPVRGDGCCDAATGLSLQPLQGAEPCSAPLVKVSTEDPTNKGTPEENCRWAPGRRSRAG